MLWSRGTTEVRGGEREIYHAIPALVWVPGTWIQHLSVFVSRSGALQLLKYYWWSTSPPCTLPTHQHQGERYTNRPVPLSLWPSVLLLVSPPASLSPWERNLDWDNVGLKTSQPSFTTGYILTVEKCKLTTWSWSQKQKMDCWSQTKAESKMRMFSISSRVSNELL